MLTKNLAYYLNIKYPVELFERPTGRYFATHPDLDGCMAEGENLADVMTNLADARELWISSRLKGGYGVPEPVSEDFSGKLSLRMAPSLHGQLARLAGRSQISLNLLINSVLASYAGGADPLTSVLGDIKAALQEINSARSQPVSAAVASTLRQGRADAMAALPSLGPSSIASSPFPALGDSTSKVLDFERKGRSG